MDENIILDVQFLEKYKICNEKLGILKNFQLLYFRMILGREFLDCEYRDSDHMKSILSEKERRNYL